MKTNVRKKSIYWLHSHFLLNTGGTRFVYDVIVKLQQYYHITVVVEKCSDYWRRRYGAIGVSVIEISPLSSNNLLYWLFFPIFFVFDVLRLKKIARHNEVLISTMFPMHAVAVFVSKNTLFYCYEPFTYFYDKTLQKSHMLLQRLLIYILAFTYGGLDRYGAAKSKMILTINKVTRYWIKQIYHREPDAVTYLGVDVNVFNMSVLPIHPKEEKMTVIFHSTDYTALKGTDNVLRAALRLKEVNMTNIHFYISETVRNEQVYLKYQKFIESYGLENMISFVGHVPYSDLPRYYRFADIYLFAGDPDSTGATSASMSVLEAAACGVPSIRTLGENDEVIDKQTGILVDPRNSSEVAEAILYLHNNRDKRQDMGRKAHDYVVSLYIWENVAKKISRGIESMRSHEKNQSSN